jgi:hypothetical protein
MTRAGSASGGVDDDGGGEVGGDKLDEGEPSWAGEVGGDEAGDWKATVQAAVSMRETGHAREPGKAHPRPGQRQERH